MSDDVRLDLLKEAIAKSGMDIQTKDVLADDLKYAQDINGTDDEALKGIKKMLISNVRKELIAYERNQKAIEAHAEACAKRRAEEIQAVIAACRVEAAAQNKSGDTFVVRGLQVCGKAALIVAAGVALALIVLAATGRFPW